MDAIIPGQAENTLTFDAIKLKDPSTSCGGNYPGPEIDAVCALVNLPCVIGSECNDGNSMTYNDTYLSNCDCIGILPILTVVPIINAECSSIPESSYTTTDFCENVSVEITEQIIEGDCANKLSDNKNVHCHR